MRGLGGLGSEGARAARGTGSGRPAQRFLPETARRPGHGPGRLARRLSSSVAGDEAVGSRRQSQPDVRLGSRGGHADPLFRRPTAAMPGATSDSAGRLGGRRAVARYGARLALGWTPRLQGRPRSPTGSASRICWPGLPRLQTPYRAADATLRCRRPYHKAHPRVLGREATWGGSGMEAWRDSRSSRPAAGWTPVAAVPARGSY